MAGPLIGHLLFFGIGVVGIITYLSSYCRFSLRRFKLEDDLAGRSTAQAFVAEGGARDIATQPFEAVPLLGAAARIGVQTKALSTDTALGLRFLLAGQAQGGVFPRQYFLPRPWSERNAVGAGCRV